MAGKADWLAYGLPFEGEADLAGMHLVREVPRCRTDDPIGAVRGALASSQFGFVVVCNDVDVVLGRLGAAAHDAADDEPVARHMREGPTTVRPSEDRRMLEHRMGHAGVDVLIVTRSDGVLLGLFERGRGEPTDGRGG